MTRKELTQDVSQASAALHSPGPRPQAPGKEIFDLSGRGGWLFQITMVIVQQMDQSGVSALVHRHCESRAGSCASSELVPAAPGSDESRSRFSSTLDPENQRTPGGSIRAKCSVVSIPSWSTWRPMRVSHIAATRCPEVRPRCEFRSAQRARRARSSRRHRGAKVSITTVLFSGSGKSNSGRGINCAVRAGRYLVEEARYVTSIGASSATRRARRARPSRGRRPPCRRRSAGSAGSRGATRRRRTRRAARRAGRASGRSPRARGRAPARRRGDRKSVV